MDDKARLQWVASHILPLESELRGWLRAHARTLDKADTDDLIQEAYARLWCTELDAVRQPRAYFYSTVRNLIAERARRARIVPMERMGEVEALRILSEEPGPEQRVGARQELERLLQAVEGLPAQCRRAFELRKFQDLSQREIATVMGIAEKTVEKHLAKALLRLGRAMGNADEDTGQAERVQTRHDEQQQSE
jgi:RNA polymerase sigma-70 factor (ECF subfamily)